MTIKTIHIKILIFVAFCFLSMPGEAFAAAFNPAFNPNQIVPDVVFSDIKTFSSPADIQKFLESKGSVLATTNHDFLLKLREPTDVATKQTLEDPTPNKGRLRTAAELIWDAAQFSGLNPQVILVTLNKEQGLITSKFNSPSNLQRALTHAMGYACPDGGGCDDTFSGFYSQLFGSIGSDGDRHIGAARSLFKSFSTPGGRGPIIKGKTAKVGDTVILTNSLGAYDGISPQQTVTIGNFATAALYRYTPHVFNGNYNFWRFYTSWFNYPNGTILKNFDTGTLFLLEKGAARQLPMFVARARKLNLKHIVTASPSELANYSTGILLDPPNKTIVTSGGKTYLFLKNIKYPASTLVLKQKGLKPTKAMHISAADAALFADGPVMIPTNGTVLRAKGKTQTYLVQNGALKLFSTLTIKQYKSRQKTHVISLDELTSYPASGYVAPLDGTLVKGKSTATVYVVKKGEKKPLTSALFSNLRYKRSKIVKLDDAMIDAIPTGTYATPREGSYFLVKESNTLYRFNNGKVHMVTEATRKKRAIRSYSLFPAEIMKDWPVGKSL